MTAPPRFRISPAVRELGVRGAFAILEGLDNRIDDSALAPLRENLAEMLRVELVEGFIENDPVLAGFRALHDRIGRSNRRFPASAESLVALFQRKGIVPVINPLVDIYNVVSLETRLSLGAHDLARVIGDIELRLTNGDEEFLPLGSTVPETVPAGEYCYIDSDRRVLCRLEHRQCEQTKVGRETSACFYILQGNAATDRTMLETTLARLIDLTLRHCGGTLAESWIVD